MATREEQKVVDEFLNCTSDIKKQKGDAQLTLQLRSALVDAMGKRGSDLKRRPGAQDPILISDAFCEDVDGSTLQFTELVMAGELGGTCRRHFTAMPCMEGSVVPCKPHASHQRGSNCLREPRRPAAWSGFLLEEASTKLPPVVVSS